jgi:hypothetical protein
MVATCWNEALSMNYPSLLKENGGAFTFSDTTARRHMHSQGTKSRKASSDRVDPPLEEIRAMRDEFVGAIKNAFPDGPPDPRLVINFDQTWHAFDPHAHQGKTWVKPDQVRIGLKKPRDGITMLPVLSLADGIVVVSS